ncbi:hypothetical protein CFC21_044393 [Triticum aestivum]|uniref:Uncharacterized protein n=2 Tax=Triticum aestivum TaxID=4565 RepID=A0A9R1FQ80_WHEAT|nr:uncharacterized protein LOC123066671 [Triticum aestivum]KAF7033282.1 hypothetical protein CFC21_044393 [Triticum aestivum]CDM86532.1 unnamed protein product [Triticum aestivum]
MDRKVCIFLVILVLAVLAGPGAKAAALDSGTGRIDAGAAVRQLMSASHSSSMKLDDGVVPELAVASVVDLEVHRRILAGAPVSPGALNPNKGVCTRSGGCGGKGNPYTGRGCNPYNFCPPK